MSTPSPASIDLPFTVEAALKVLHWGTLTVGSPFSHQQLAQWCDRFWCHYLHDDAPAELKPLLPILTAVETQWDLFLVNTYSFEELRTGAFEQARMPIEWFEEWLQEANDQTLPIARLNPPPLPAVRPGDAA